MHKYFALIIILATTSVFGMRKIENSDSEKKEIPFCWFIENDIGYSNIERSGPEYQFVDKISGLYMTCSDVVKLYKADKKKNLKSPGSIPEKHKPSWLTTTYHWLKKYVACESCNKKQSTKRS